MAKILFGESIVSLYWQNYTLRPSFEALYEIEQQTGKSISALIMAAQQRTLNNTTIRIIISEGLAAAGTFPPFLFKWSHLARDAHNFLMCGIGHNPSTQPSDEIIEPDWHDMFMSYVGVMGKPAKEFWSLTLSEYALIMEGFCMQQGIDTHSTARPATSKDLAEMLKQFPDKPAASVANDETSSRT